MGRSGLLPIRWATSAVVASGLTIAPTCPAKDVRARCQKLISKIPEQDRKEVLSSVTKAGEATPRGVNRTMSWRDHGRIAAGNNATGYAAFLPWGQVFAVDEQQHYAPATIAIRRLRAYVLSRKTDRWKLVTSTNRIDGRLYLPNYEGNESAPANIVLGASHSTVILDPNRSFHFWPAENKVPIDGPDVGGILVSYESRIIDRNSPGTRYLVSAGADYWRATNSRWMNLTTNGDAGIGRFILVTSSWRTTFMSTSSLSTLNKCID